MKHVQRSLFGISVVALLSLPISVMAMSKDEAIKQCLQEMKVPVSTAKQCKASGWETQACQNLKSRIRPCAKSKMLGS